MLFLDCPTIIFIMKDLSKNPYVYVIEDEQSISDLICMYLSQSEIGTKAFSNAEDALANFEKDRQPDLIILDLNLPGMSGFDFLNELKKKYSDTERPAVMILSARDADEDMIKGLGLGADEFVTKPFSPSVLVARVKANLRRQISASAKAEDSIRFDDFTLLLNSCVLKKGSQKIPLSSKEYEVLEYLVKNAGKTLVPEQIYQAVWKVDFGDITAVAVYVQRLRKKLQTDADGNEYIRTVFGKGYVFNQACIIK